MIDLGAAIAGGEFVRVGGQRIGFRLGRHHRIDRQGEGEQESVRTDVNLLQFERRLPCPVDALNRKRFLTAHRPLAIGGESSGEQLPHR